MPATDRNIQVLDEMWQTWSWTLLMHEIDWEPAEVNSNPHNFDQSWEIDFKTFTNILGLHYFQNFSFQNIDRDIIMLLMHCG